jgi:hypothetical protein
MLAMLACIFFFVAWFSQGHRSLGRVFKTEECRRWIVFVVSVIITHMKSGLKGFQTERTPLPGPEVFVYSEADPVGVE